MNFSINGEEISAIEHIKYLGIQVDQCMSWENLIAHVLKKNFKGPSCDTPRKILPPTSHIADHVQKYS